MNSYSLNQYPYMIVFFVFVVFLSSCTKNSQPILLFPNDIKKNTHQPPSNPTDELPPKTLLLSDAAYLRKLSLHIRGIPPSKAEYNQLSEAKNNKGLDDFLIHKTKEYLSSNHHIEKMNNRLNEHFRLRTNTYYNTTDWPILQEELENDEKGEFPYITYVQSYLHRNSLNDLFRSIVRENLSWDQLLLKKNYQIFINKTQNNINFGSIDDKSFYYPLAKSQLPPTASGFVNLQFNADDARIAGALTTPRFFSRYPNTSVNKNRKRAAAIFRMFLCDSMNTVALDASQNEEQILKKVFPERNSIIINASKDRHGNDAACIKCHYKLDPMGMTFAGSNLSVSPSASRGALVFKRIDSEKIEIPVDGIGTLAQKITQQPEYVRCQTQLFWNWFVGNDVPISETDFSTLQSKFDHDKRRVNDFIEYLVSTPQFKLRSESVSENEIERKVKLILRRCDSCHKEEQNIPNFENWPIGGSESSMKIYVDKIAKALDVFGNGKSATMPPSTSSWRLSDQEKNTIQLWVQMQSESNRSSNFNPVQLRYLGGPDIILTLANKFPLWKSKSNKGVVTSEVPSSCRFSTSETSSKIGVSSPKTGMPTHENPSPSMARWLLECGRSYIESDFKNSILDGQLSNYFSIDIQNKFRLDQKEKLQVFLQQRWSQLNPDLKRLLVSYWVEYLVGPEEILSDVTQGQFVSLTEFSDSLINKMPTTMNQLRMDEIIPKLFLTLIMNDSFLRY